MTQKRRRHTDQFKFRVALMRLIGFYQAGSGCAVHGTRLHRRTGGRRHSRQHGWPGAGLCSIFVERLWRTVKYEDIHIRNYASPSALTRALEAYFRFYNHERYHQSLDYAVPAAV